ncbi:MAG: putative Na+/H+ antiporter [Betaproteobacteria bacterium]
MHSMTAGNPIQVGGAILFGFAVLHTFSTKYFRHLANANTAHAGLWRLLGEVGIVFGLWACVLLALMAATGGWRVAIDYLDTSRFVEPLFVLVIMVICASRPILQLVSGGVGRLAGVLPLPPATACYFLTLSAVPLLGSLITEPAAMTIAALMLREIVFSRHISKTLQYATLGVLFVNVSAGGTLTSFAAPPVLMVTANWGWDTPFVFSMFGWKAVTAVLTNAVILTLFFRKELARKARAGADGAAVRTPVLFTLLNLALLAGVIASAHDPEIFIGLFLLFLGLAEAYQRFHDKLLLREGLMVALFIAGLVVLGGQQRWWLQEVLSRLDETTIFFAAAALTAITDNAVLTYFGSLVDGVSADFKYALVAGAVAGGGLTVIANAPNPAGFAILRDSFDERSISPLGLLLGALPPTLVVVLCFQWVDSLDRTFMFVLILPLVLAAVGLWSETLRNKPGRHATKDLTDENTINDDSSDAAWR